MAQKLNLIKALQQERISFEKSYGQHQKYHPVFKGTICLLLIEAFLVYRMLWPSINVNGIRDAYQNFTEPLNRQMVAYPDEGSA